MTDGDSSDVLFWRSVASGDAGARARLADLAHGVARAELLRRRAEVQSIDDLAQDVVRSTLAFASRNREAPRDLRAFLKYRTWGVLSDHRKRMRTALPTIATDEAAEPRAREPGPARRAERGQLAQALAECTARLSAEQRTSIELRYSVQLESDDIAARMGVHRNTVHVRVFRALAALRECLARKGFAPEDLEP